MKIRTLLLATLLLSTSGPGRDAQAAEIKGVSFADSASAGGSTLALNGMAMRTKLFIKVYAIGLYLESKESDPSKVLAADGKRLARMVMKLGLSGEKIGTTIGEAFEKNPANNMAALTPRLDRLKALFPGSEKGDIIDLAYVPGTGTTISHSGKPLGTGWSPGVRI